ncbi:MAG: acyltransferase family protein, partial [Flavobacteriaceae bacterium]
MNVQSSGPSAKIITAGPRIDHVDGLRAIAVIAVVAYHASIPGFATGFTGVDIFFVISGFLIINQIVGELRQNRFSLATFYARRTIRILPPLLVMLLGAYLIACFVLISPFEWENFGLSGSLSAVFLSNFYFYKKQGYFDTTAMDKPLLHTWSLSVEEQFYIITPLLLIGLFLLARRTRKPVSTYLAGAGGIFFIASLIGCILLTIPVKNKAFYMTTWRGWEFIAGGAVAWLAAQPALQSRRWIAEAAGLAGIVLAVVAINFGLSEINYPSYGAITPVAAAVLLILSGLLDPDCTAARLLSVRPMVLVGLISYSWYLWHWPLISMAQIAQFSTENHLRDAVMAGLSLIPAVLSYRYVELPCRRWRHARDLRALGWMPVRRGLAASLAVFALNGTTGGAVYALTRYGPEIAGDPSLIDPPRIVCTGDSCKVPGH